MVLIQHSGRVLYPGPATSPEILILTARTPRTIVNPVRRCRECWQEQSGWLRKALDGGGNPVFGKKSLKARNHRSYQSCFLKTFEVKSCHYEQEICFFYCHSSFYNFDSTRMPCLY